MDKVSRCKRLTIGMAGSLVVSSILGWTSVGFASEPVPSTAPSAVAPAQAKPLDLAGCRSLALEHQPAIAAYKASLEASNVANEALNNLGLASLVVHDLPVRRDQAALGNQIAQARVRQAELEATYAVTRTYLLVLYARQQQDLLDKTLTDLRDLRDTVKQIVDDGLRADVTTRDLERLNLLVMLAEARREEAVNGQERAKAALREAMGFGADFTFDVVGRVLPNIKRDFTKQQIVDFALSKRNELVQVTSAAEIFCLEVRAQSLSHHQKANTFASGADLHANPVPQGSQDGEYRPGAIGPEMPGILAGNRSERMQQASAYHERAQAVVQKTRNLITLEVEDAFYRWKDANRKTASLLEAADKGEKLGRDLREDFKTPGAKVKLDEVLLTGILAGQLRGQANDSIRDLAMILASLERITAGGVIIDFSVKPKP
jgi:outer membrane protein TolC